MRIFASHGRVAGIQGVGRCKHRGGSLPPLNGGSPQRRLPPSRSAQRLHVDSTRPVSANNALSSKAASWLSELIKSTSCGLPWSTTLLTQRRYVDLTKVRRGGHHIRRRNSLAYPALRSRQTERANRQAERRGARETVKRPYESVY